MDSVSQIPIFYPRWDHTGIVMAIGLIFWSAFPSAGIRENSLIQIALLSVTVLQWSRASIFAVTCASIFVLWRNHKIFKGVHRKKSKLVTRVLIVILLLTIAFPLLQGYLPEYNVLSRLGIVHSANDALAGADHTKNARIRCQAALMNWVIEEDKLLFGSGAGSEMLIESGAYQFLSGSELVRSPHSWFYGGLARFGIFGFASWIMILTINLAKRPRGEFYLIGLSCVVLICFISLFGVIVESPFGSLPLAFFLAFSGYRKTQFSQDS
jgi:hypothetical protein